jgi:hypothetical protein
MSPALAQMMDVNKAQISKLLGRFWVSDLAIGDTAKLNFVIFCSDGDELYMVDALINSSKEENANITVRMRPGKSLDIKSMTDAGFDLINGNLIGLLDCKMYKTFRSLNPTTLRVYSINDATKLSTYLGAPQ